MEDGEFRVGLSWEPWCRAGEDRGLGSCHGSVLSLEPQASLSLPGTLGFSKDNFKKGGLLLLLF